MSNSANSRNTPFSEFAHPPIQVDPPDFSPLFKSLREFANDLERIIDRPSTVPFIAFAHELNQFLSHSPPENKSDILMIHQKISRICGQTVVDAGDERQEFVRKAILIKVVTATRALTATDWPARDQLPALHSALEELDECLYRLQFDPSPGTSTLGLSTFIRHALFEK